MKKLLALFAGVIMLTCVAAGMTQAVAKTLTPPEIDIYVDVSNQTMTVDVDGWTYGRWKVSTARDGYHTPRGTWRPFMMTKMHYSKKYDNSPMPNSIFFLGGYAIHATYYVNQLGRPASHGCVRLHPQNAAKLYALIQQHGLSATRITIGD